MNTLAPLVLIGSSSILQVTRPTIKSRVSSKLGQIGPWTAELAARYRLHRPTNGAMLVPSFLIGTFSFLLETRTYIYIKAWMSLNFNQIRPLTTDLPDLERLKNQYVMFTFITL